MGAHTPTFSSLSPAEKNLIRLIQSIGCGRLRHLAVREGQPCFEAPLTAVRRVRLVKANTTQLQVVPTGAGAVDFPLKREMLDLLAQIRGIKYGMVERLEVLHGLPTAIEIAEPLALPKPTSGTSTATPGL
jgi:hypothetical protein